MNGRSALLGDSDRDGAAAMGMVGDLQCLPGLHQCCVSVHQVRGPVCSLGCPLASLSQTWAVRLGGYLAGNTSICSGEIR